jgi:septal ring factor EnvC (AmiA/AmiB activator)
VHELNKKEKEDRLKSWAVLISKKNERLKDIENQLKLLEKDLKSQLSEFRLKVNRLLKSG